MNKANPDDLVIAKEGFLAIQVCAPTAWSREQIQRVTNEKHLCGTTGGWQFPDKYDDPAQEPVQCADCPTNTHYILYA